MDIQGSGLEPKPFSDSGSLSVDGVLRISQSDSRKGDYHAAASQTVHGSFLCAPASGRRSAWPGAEEPLEGRWLG